MKEGRKAICFFRVGHYIWASADVDGVACHLADFDHQSLIETIEKVWPNWFDSEQWLAKREN